MKLGKKADIELDEKLRGRGHLSSLTRSMKLDEKSGRKLDRKLDKSNATARLIKLVSVSMKRYFAHEFNAILSSLS